jgi:hypothetical protein
LNVARQKKVFYTDENRLDDTAAFMRHQSRRIDPDRPTSNSSRLLWYLLAVNVASGGGGAMATPPSTAQSTPSAVCSQYGLQLRLGGSTTAVFRISADRILTITLNVAHGKEVRDERR